jgi:hypothetical protein
MNQSSDELLSEAHERNTNESINSHNIELNF